MKSRLRRLLIFLICLSLAGGFLFVHVKHVFTFQHIECEMKMDELRPCSSEIEQIFQSWQGKSIFFTDLGQERQHILSQNPLMTDVQATPSLPDTLHIQVTLTQPAYALQDKDDGKQKLLLVSPAGQVFASADPQEKLHVGILQIPDALYAQITSDSHIDNAFHQHAQEIFSTLHTENFNTAALIYLSPEQLEMHLSDGKVVFLRPDHFAEDLAKTEFILKSFHFSSLSAPAKSIDVRFNYPVVKTQ